MFKNIFRISCNLWVNL